jgi:VIT1/CCC1 family predicted Fe2+/Mn2+ transporter
LPAVGLAVGCAALGLFLVGSLITLLTGRSVLFSGGRQLLFGMLAAGVTFGLGRLIGAAVGA